jgi:hypothetical protein
LLRQYGGFVNFQKSRLARAAEQIHRGFFLNSNGVHFIKQLCNIKTKLDRSFIATKRSFSKPLNPNNLFSEKLSTCSQISQNRNQHGTFAGTIFFVAFAVIKTSLPPVFQLFKIKKGAHEENNLDTFDGRRRKPPC